MTEGYTESSRLTRIKASFNWSLDRVIEACDLTLMDAWSFPWAGAQRVAHRTVRGAGDFCLLVKDFPRMSAYRIGAAGSQVVFVGSGRGLQEISRLLYPGTRKVPEELGRFEVRRLADQVGRWLDGGAALVVCELSRLSRGLAAPLAFSVPLWVHQVIDIPQDFGTILAGRRHKDMRERINKARRAGFEYRFSRAEEDLREFYEKFYRPFVKMRHGDLALVTPYRHQWERWFRRGGLIVATRHGLPVAGLIAYVAGGTCFLIETGVSTADPQLRHMEINAFLCLAALTWAHGRGARKCDMGGSHPCRSDGPFRFKKDWGAQVERRRRIYPEWRFAARELPDALLRRLNEIGFISEIGREFYGVVVTGESSGPGQDGIEDELRAAKKAGLTGVAIVSTEGRRLLPCR